MKGQKRIDKQKNCMISIYFPSLFCEMIIEMIWKSKKKSKEKSRGKTDVNSLISFGGISFDCGQIS